jgi:hypothetical protein
MGNGNNKAIHTFDAEKNNFLQCILVDKPDIAKLGVGVYKNWNKNSLAQYSDKCDSE